MVVVLGGVQLDEAVAAGVVHVDDVEGEPLDHVGQHKPCAIHGVGKAQEHGQVVGAGAALVGSQHHKGLGGPDPVGLYRVVVELDLGHRRTGSTDVSRRSVHQQVLTCAVETVLGSDGSGLQEGVPGKLVHVGVVGASCVGAYDCYVVPGVGYEGVNQQSTAFGGLSG